MIFKYFSPPKVYASIQDPIAGAGIGSFTDLVQNIVVFVYAVLGIVFFAMIVYGGFTWLTSQGQPDKIKQATSIIVSAVIGAIIAFAAGAVTGIFQSVTGIQF